MGGAVAGLRNPGKLVRELHALGMRHVAYGATEELYAKAGKAPMGHGSRFQGSELLGIFFHWVVGGPECEGPTFMAAKHG